VDVGAGLDDPLVGQRLDGRYDVVARIARGGMATVYRAVDLRLDRTVALKVMLRSFAEDPGFVDRFVREAKAAARLSHPNLVAVFDQGRDGDHAFLAMELVEGRTLRELLRQRGRLSAAQALSVIEPVLAALEAAHAAGLVHRDVKPENVLLADDGRVKLADFGLARAIESTSSAATGTMLIGTVAYLAPEQVEHGIADARSDVYAAGIVLFEMLTGEPPYSAPTAMAVAYRHVHEDVPAPSSVVDGIPPQVDDLVVRATRRDPDRRPGTAGELRSDTVVARRALAVLAPDAPSDSPMQATQVIPRDALIAARPEAAVEPAVKERRPGNRRRRVIALALALVTIAAGATGWWLGSGRYTDAPGVVGLQLVAAQHKLKDAGFDAKRGADVFSTAIDKGLVADQDPDRGHRVRRHGTVVLHLSKGPELHAVPTLRGLTATAATTALTKSKLAVGTLRDAYDDVVPTGRIISSTPPKGELLAPGSVVDLIVSKGPAPVDIPDLVGKSKGDALAALNRLGLKSDVTEVFDESVPKDVVMDQSPRAAAGHRGDVVKLTISKGPQLFEVPDVRGKTRKDATRILQDAGFEVTVSNIPGPGDRVIAQSPAPHSMRRRGTVVTIYVF
jgi:serine/threonine-protein kinase